MSWLSRSASSSSSFPRLQFIYVRGVGVGGCSYHGNHSCWVFGVAGQGGRVGERREWMRAGADEAGVSP